MNYSLTVVNNSGVKLISKLLRNKISLANREICPKVGSEEDVNLIVVIGDVISYNFPAFFSCWKC